MRRLLILSAVLFLLLPASGLSQQDTPAQAQAILSAAVKQAASSEKNVFLIFHASWCSWCRKLEGVLEASDVKELIGKNYVVARLDVQERGDKKQTLENPGAGDIMKDLGGEKSGLPFYVILDRQGKKIADSNVMPGNNNIGYPGAPEEIAAFEKILKQTAPRLTDQERAEIMKHFKAQPHT